MANTIEGLRYIINPPKQLNNEVLFKHIIVAIVDNGELIGAHEYSLEGVPTPVAITDIELPASMAVNHKSEIYQDLDYQTYRGGHPRMNSGIREYWSFPTAEMAYLQKLLMLAKIREKLIDDILRFQKELDSTIPSNIKNILKEANDKHPEYFL